MYKIEKLIMLISNLFFSSCLKIIWLLMVMLRISLLSNRVKKIISIIRKNNLSSTKNTINKSSFNRSLVHFFAAYHTSEKLECYTVSLEKIIIKMLVT
ncbi:hypothetical protein BpHYR1_051441 [Brachionus plicatilis]|uniref:Uncharacterized protein n=1 Tax=Brachionus plicatilis TaxID=10195 RepID=A0A3M7SHC0_BRAPC|nr:hypothetical protein BpHYR1_051441 [Brachionus plicatilis]